MLAFQEPRDKFWTLVIKTIQYLPSHLFFVYSLIYFLIPRLLLKRKYALFILFFIPILIIAVGYILFLFLQSCGCFQNLENINIRLFGRALFTTFNIAGIAVAIKLFKYWQREREGKLEAEKSNLVSQLEILKSQVHPHFLFNTLNNLYSLTLEKSERSPEIVLKLSSLLRYMLYECNEKYINLGREIEMINYYIELEKIRYGARLDIFINFSGDYKDKNISPLMLLPFVENCFKHGTSEQIDQCWINIELIIENNILFFKLINSHRTDPNATIQNEGIGLNNVRKRLDLLYRERYILKLIPAEETFTVILELKIN